jgi:adenosylmethionine-8-amino-7-oxononanoate aminotransferase
MNLYRDHKRLEALDKDHVWHPFTQMREWAESEPVIIAEGRGAFLKDLSGNWYIDGVSSLWVNIHGHRRSEIDDAIIAQLSRIAHSTLLGLANVPAVELAGRLVELLERDLAHGAWQPQRQTVATPITPGVARPLRQVVAPPLTRVFYSDNGSTAVEVALKMAFQYWRHRGENDRNTFLSLDNAYHGDTLGAMSVGGIDIFHATFKPLLSNTFKAPSPYCYRCGPGLNFPDCGLACAEKLGGILRANRGKIAAVIIEPLIQAAGGMITSPPGYLAMVARLCRDNDTLLIADEVATGFGRTGKMFACGHEGVSPDIICLSKGITGGYMPLAATVATEEIHEAFLGRFDEMKTFYHGHSYTGNPLACAAALACLDVFEKDATLEKLQPKIEFLQAWLKEVSNLPHVGEARNAGFMAGVELVRNKEFKEPYGYAEKAGWRVALAVRKKGVLIRPLGNVVVIMPPLVIELEDLRTMLGHIGEAIGDL